MYQLRGRVGRSETQAYAYLVVPKDSALNSETEKRLDAMTRYQYLGAGKDIALRDMEIRGVGNILGKEQSGNVNSIGLNLFMKFLKNAVDKKRNFKEVDEIELPVFELDENMGIPENFIPDIVARLQIYQEMSLVYQTSNLDDLKEYRPGLKAAGEFSVRHPFVELGLKKEMVRELAKEMKLKVSISMSLKR